MDLKLTYATNYKLDSNLDAVWAQHIIELNPDEEKLYLNALKNGEEFAEAEGMRDLFELALKQIEKREEENYLDYESLVAMAEMGQIRMDPEIINDLVDRRDPYTLKFFKLTKKSKEQLAKWDANELPEDELPLMRDFKTTADYEKPSYPEWKITVCFSAPDEEVVKQILKELFEENEDDYSVIYDFVDNMVQLNTDCDYTLEELVQEVVEELGIEGFEF